MSIFKRREPVEVQQPGAGASSGATKSEQGEMLPPFVRPGVVPPAAAPMYSMHAAEGAKSLEGGAELVAERVTMVRDAQQRARESVENRVRIALHGARKSSGNGVHRQPTQQAALVPVTAPVTHVCARPGFDPVRCAQAGLINLAWSWQQAGATIRAINTYAQVLARYPDTPAAAAAVSDLVELSDKLVQKGQFHTALGIYERLERLL